MKLRIIKKGDYYYPQCRQCFIWWNFVEGYTDSTVKRSSFKLAEDVIREIQEKMKNRLEKSSKQVIKEYFT